MALRLAIHAPTLTAPLVLYETGASESRLYERGIGTVTRRVDLYTGRDSTASAGRIKTTLDNRDALLSPDGVFAPRWRDVLLVASIDGDVVFVGRAERISEGTAGVQVVVHWRDLVDDFFAQQIEGVPGRIAGANVRAATTLRAVLETYGIEAVGLPTLDMWLPEETTTLRRWLLPALSALGYTVDWSATLSADATQFTVSLIAQSEIVFGNESLLPLFSDQDLIGHPTWDSGREQVFNRWSGERRFWDEIEREFKNETVEADGGGAKDSLPALSREFFGDRKAGLALVQLRIGRATLQRYMDDLINRRAWPHPRGTMTLQGAFAASLRIGDGFLSTFDLGASIGRGLHRVWRVHGRTIDLLTETIKVEAEMRDDRDPDYRSWVAGGAGVVEPNLDVVENRLVVVAASTVEIRVRLTSQPASRVVVTAFELSGDISVEPARIEFTGRDFDVFQIFRVTAANMPSADNLAVPIVLTATGGSSDTETVTVVVFQGGRSQFTLTKDTRSITYRITAVQISRSGNRCNLHVTRIADVNADTDIEIGDGDASFAFALQGGGGDDTFEMTYDDLRPPSADTNPGGYNIRTTVPVDDRDVAPGAGRHDPVPQLHRCRRERPPGAAHPDRRQPGRDGDWVAGRSVPAHPHQGHPLDHLPHHRRADLGVGQSLQSPRHPHRRCQRRHGHRDRRRRRKLRVRPPGRRG